MQQKNLRAAQGKVQCRVPPGILGRQECGRWGAVELGLCGEQGEGIHCKGSKKQGKERASSAPIPTLRGVLDVILYSSGKCHYR